MARIISDRANKTDQVVLLPSSLEDPTKAPPGAYRILIWTVCASISAFFAALVIAYIWRSGMASYWQPFRLPRVLWLSTALILASSATLETARRVFRRGLWRVADRLLLVTAALGLVFLGAQLEAWRDLLAQGAYLLDNPHGAFFYLFTGLHAVHLLGGLIGLFVVLFGRRKRRELVDVVAYYWHFLCVLWLVLFGVLKDRLLIMSPVTNAQIAPTARVHRDAVIGAGAVIGDFCVIEQDVKIGAGCMLEPYVYVKRWTTLGKHNRISAGTVLGTDPLDKGFKGERSYLKIGDGNQVREHYTISRGTAPESETVIGDENYIMTSGHIAHNCKIGNQTVIASGALIAGYAEIEDQAFISGNVVVHQYSKIGRLAMIGGGTRVNQDVPPYFLYSDFNVTPTGLNRVGLRRAGFDAGEIAALKAAYKILYRSGLKLDDALASIEHNVSTEHTRHLVKFIRSSTRGIARE